GHDPITNVHRRSHAGIENIARRRVAANLLYWRTSVSVIVVSNRVARIKPNDPIAGGLAAALLPMVRDSGAIWVGSSDQPRDVTQTGDVTQTREFAKIESLGAGALATVDMPAKHYRGFYEGFANSA